MATTMTSDTHRATCATLHAIVDEAFDALARLDGERLEALVSSCDCIRQEIAQSPIQKLNSANSPIIPLRTALGVFHRLLGLTRANQRTIELARQHGQRQLEYSARGWTLRRGD